MTDKSEFGKANIMLYGRYNLFSFALTIASIFLKGKSENKDVTFRFGGFLFCFVLGFFRQVRTIFY